MAVRKRSYLLLSYTEIGLHLPNRLLYRFYILFFLLDLVVIVRFLTVIGCPFPNHSFPSFAAELF